MNNWYINGVLILSCLWLLLFILEELWVLVLKEEEVSLFVSQRCCCFCCCCEGIDDSALGLDLDLGELDMEYRILFEVFPDFWSFRFWIVGRDGGSWLEYGLISLSCDDTKCLLRKDCDVVFNFGAIVVMDNIFYEMYHCFRYFYV